MKKLGGHEFCVVYILCILQTAQHRIHRNNEGEFIYAQMVLVYFCGPALDGAVSIISGPFIAGDVGDGCPVCHLGDKRLIRVLPWLALGCVLDVVGVAIAPGYPLRLHIVILPGLIRLLKGVKSPCYCVLPQCVLPYGLVYTLDTHWILITHRNIAGPRGH